MFVRYKTSFWAISNQSLYCAGRTKSYLSSWWVRRSQRYGGARSCKDLKTIILDSSVISYSMVLNPNLSISSLLGVPKLLLVTILAAL